MLEKSFVEDFTNVIYDSFDVLVSEESVLIWQQEKKLDTLKNLISDGDEEAIALFLTSLFGFVVTQESVSECYYDLENLLKDVRW